MAQKPRFVAGNCYAPITTDGQQLDRAQLNATSIRVKLSELAPVINEHILARRLLEMR